MPKLIRELDDLVAKGVITPETAENILLYYDHSSRGTSRLKLVFSIIGALLVLMGVGLIIAHNWDAFLSPVKLAFGLAPLLIPLVDNGLTMSWRSFGPYEIGFI